MQRKKQLSNNLEDYLEAIYLIIKKCGEARSKEIMKRLNVSGPSVTEALQLLAKKKLVNYRPYENITLTREGEVVAKDVLHRHETLRTFFIEVLGVDRETADHGACKMEHAASPEIIERMIKYTHFLKHECETCGNKSKHGFVEFIQKQKK